MESFKYRSIPNNPTVFPSVDRVYRIDFDYSSDGKEHRLTLKLNTKQKGDIDSGERLEALTFYIDEGMITIGCEGSAGDYKDYDYDFDIDYLKNGIAILILPETKTQSFHFGVSWRTVCEDKTDAQTWYGADPSYS